MDQLLIFVIILNSASDFSCFLLTGFKISVCRSEERNNRGMSKKRVRKFGKDEMLVFKGNTKLKTFRITRFSFLSRPNT